MHGKKGKETTIRRRPVPNPTIQLNNTTVNMYTKYELSILCRSGGSLVDIRLDYQYRDRKIRSFGRPVKAELTHSLTLSYAAVDISLTKMWRERKLNKYREALIREGPFSIPQYNKSVLTHIINMILLP